MNKESKRLSLIKGKGDEDRREAAKAAIAQLNELSLNGELQDFVLIIRKKDGSLEESSVYKDITEMIGLLEYHKVYKTLEFLEA